MSDHKKINWIFFDLDDTIWNFSANSAKALKELYKISPILKKLFKDIEEFISIYHKNNFLLWDMYSRGEITTAQLKLERWRRTLATKQFEVLTAVCEELERNYLDILALGEETFPGMDSMLNRLRKDYILAVLSNGFSKTQYKKLGNSGLWRYITRTIVSEEIGINKPDPRIFRYAIEETGAEEPYLMVGDNPESDIFGAMRAGWKAIWFNPNDKPFPYSKKELSEKNVNPDNLIAVVKNIGELERAIEKVFNRN